jgi:signal transduction protein with GAF and PtsI domain
MTGDNHSDSSITVPRPLKRLMEAHQILADTESVQELLPRLLDLARNVSNAEAASLLLYNQQRDVLEFAAVRDEVLGEKAREILKSSVELKMGEGIAGWVAQNRESVLIQDVQNDPRFFSQADDKNQCPQLQRQARFRPL